LLVDNSGTGNANPAKLTIKKRHLASGESKKFNFKAIPFRDIDWNNRTHIQQIREWRATIFRQNHFSTKKVYVWFTPAEDAWLMLHHRKIRAAIEAGHDVKILGPALIAEAFNAFFSGKVYLDETGNDMAPRPPREADSIRGKFSQRVGKLAEYRKATAKLVEGKKGGKVYMPGITEEELKAYQEDGTVGVDDLGENEKLDIVTETGNGKKTSPKRKREEKDDGEKEAKRVKQMEDGNGEPVGKPVNDVAAEKET
jgi:hypothetical protein